MKIVLMILVASIGQAETPPLRLVQTIPLPNVEGRIDHMAVDVAGQRLFIAALGNNSVEVVDLKAGKRERTLGGFHEPQGLAWIAERNALFVASGRDEACHVVDGRSFASTAVSGKIADADNVRYDARWHRVYVGCGKGELRIFDVKDWKVAGSVKLPAHPEGFQLGAQIFVNLPEKRSVAVIDHGEVMASWSLQTGGNFPMALDESGGRLFIGCRSRAALIVLDLSGKQIALVPIDGDADDLFYDSTRNRVYISCGAGFVDLVDGASLKVAVRVPTASGARTSLFVPELDRLYVGVPHRGAQEAEVRVIEVVSN